MSYEKINAALAARYGNPQDYSLEQLVAMQKSAEESGLAEQLRSMIIADARNLPANPAIPEGTDPVIAALAKTQPNVADKLLKLEELQRQLADSLASFKEHDSQQNNQSNGPPMK